VTEHVSAEPGGGPSRWVIDALARLPLPRSPVQEPWEFSASAVIGPHLPPSLRLAPRLLDRFGKVRITSHGLAVDQRIEVPWRHVIEMRTRSLLEVVTIIMTEKIADRSTMMVPPVPGVGKAMTLVASKVAEAAFSLFLVPVMGHAHGLGSQVPIAIDYMDGRRRMKTMSPGLLSTAVLALPPVSDSVLATATQHDVRITEVPPPPNGPSAERILETLRQAQRMTADRIVALRQSQPDHADESPNSQPDSALQMASAQPPPQPRRGRPPIQYTSRHGDDR
jgi:hypothetical protein